jgi:hypothetical protein
MSAGLLGSGSAMALSVNTCFYLAHGFLHLKLCDANKKQKLNNAAIGKNATNKN